MGLPKLIDVLHDEREADLAIAFLHIIAELSAVAGGVQPVLKHVVGVRAVVASHACLVLHTAALVLSGPCKPVKIQVHFQMASWHAVLLPVMKHTHLTWHMIVARAGNTA